MNLPTVQEFGRLAVKAKLLTDKQLQSAMTELGFGRIDLNSLIQVCIRKELLTNFQTERLKEGKERGYFHGNYKLLYYIGSGNAARVFRAVNVKDGSVRVVKALRNRFLAKPMPFIREGEESLILDHPNIARVYEVGKRPGDIYIVEEFISGQNLKDFLKIRRRLSPQDALPIMADICSGLQYAFDLGVAHRDLKMSNVMLSGKGQAKITDFCISAAKSAVTSRTDMPEESTYMRSCDYDGLEKAAGVKRGDLRGDIFFAGCILYELLCGIPPIEINHDRLVKTDPQQYVAIPPITKYVAHTIPGIVLSLVRKAMEVDYSKRYQTPSAMLHDINVVMDKLENEPSASGVFSNSVLENTQSLTLHSFMLVEGNIKLQDKIREMFRKVNWRILITVDPQRAFDLFYKDREIAECLVFLCKSLDKKVIKVFNNLHTLDTTTSRVRALIVLDSSQADWSTQICTDQWRVLLQMPMTANDLLAQMKELIKKPL